MIKALLLDLDGTLLDHNIEVFLQGYLKSLSIYMAPWVRPERLVPQLLKSTSVMLANHRPDRTLQEAFAEDFFPAIGIPEAQLLPRFEGYYRQEFPKLVGLTRRREAAVHLVKSALERGLQVAVATNPLFPLLPIEHRLEWAGVSTREFAYSVVTSYETFHSAKPQLAYYAELLGHLGVHAHEAGMVGDNVLDDLIPARTLGMATFHVAPEPDPAFPGGSLEDAIAWYPKAESQPASLASRNPANVLARLHGQLGAVLTLLEGLTPDRWAWQPAPGQWSITEIICHLRDIDREVHTPRVDMILSSDSPFLPPVDTDPWARERDYARQSGSDALAVLTEHRVQMLQRLESIPPGAWERPARHALLGPTTLGEVLRIAADHELLHLVDLRRQSLGGHRSGAQLHRRRKPPLHSSSRTL